MTQRKVLFLDIDGVLNNTASTLTKIGRHLKTPAQVEALEALRKECGRADGTLGYGPEFTIETIDPLAVALVNRLLEKDAELDIVLSSSHRMMYSRDKLGSAEHLRLLRLYLAAMGLNAGRVVDVTPMLYTRRGQEVIEYLNNHDEIEVSCVLDDDSDFMNPETFVMDCVLVQTNSTLGFTSGDYFTLANLLGISESNILF